MVLKRPEFPDGNGDDSVVSPGQNQSSVLGTEEGTDKTKRFWLDAFHNLLVSIKSVFRVLWITDVDWGKGTIPSTIEVSGVENAAIVRLKDNGNLLTDIDYDVSGEYTPSDGALIEADGVARLKVQSGGGASFPFTTPSNYTISDAKLLQVIGGDAVLRVTEVVGHWHLNESTGSNAPDDSGQGNDGTLNNMEDGDWIAAKLGNGLIFDGVDEFVDLGAIADFERTDSFSIEFWFKTTTSGAELIITKQINSGTFRGWNVFIESGVITTALISDNGASNRLQLKTNATFNDGSFHHCVVTYDGSSTVAGLNIFIDGADVATTTVTDNLSATISHGTNAQISGRAGANVVFDGTIDEVVIYSFELSSAQVTIRFNSGTGTETLTGSYPTSNPTIINNTGFVFSAALNAFLEASTTPAGTAIKYHVSSDNGVTFKYWDGAAWTVTDDSFAQANDVATINTNIGALAGSGTFKFRALLNSDGTATPELDSVIVQEAVIFSTTDNLFIDTKDASQVAPSTLIAWLTATISNTLPASTDIKLLASVDGRVSWLTWNGSAWVAPASDTTRTDGTSIADFQTNFGTLPVGNETLDIRLFLQTSDDSVTPTVSNIAITSNSGFEVAGVYETNIFDSDTLNQDWGEVNFSTIIPGGTSIVIKTRASNNVSVMGAYGAALADGDNAGVVGQFISFELTFAGLQLESPSIDQLSTKYVTPSLQDVNP